MIKRSDCEIVMLIGAAGPVCGPQDSLVTMITLVCDANPLNMSPGRPRHIDTHLYIIPRSQATFSAHSDPYLVSLNYFECQAKFVVPQRLLRTTRFGLEIN